MWGTSESSHELGILPLVAVQPALDRWQGVKGSRPADIDAALDAPPVLALYARQPGPTASAAAPGACARARRRPTA